jgi:hypothetical protein
LQNNRQQLDTLQQIQQTINTPLPGTIVATPGVEDRLEALV